MEPGWVPSVNAAAEEQGQGEHLHRELAKQPLLDAAVEYDLWFKLYLANFLISDRYESLLDNLAHLYIVSC